MEISWHDISLSQASQVDNPLRQATARVDVSVTDVVCALSGALSPVLNESSIFAFF